jgi:hypothetical protein
MRSDAIDATTAKTLTMTHTTVRRVRVWPRLIGQRRATLARRRFDNLAPGNDALTAGAANGLTTIWHQKRVGCGLCGAARCHGLA